jgi:SAM-dependent methyltransferase
VKRAGYGSSRSRSPPARAAEAFSLQWYGRPMQSRPAGAHGGPSGELDAKRETQKQWNTDPCGARTAPEYEAGTPEFFGRVEHERYDVYAPWMRAAIGFEEHAGEAVLEIGPGLGTDHAQFARAGARMFALDLTNSHLQLTRQRFRNEALSTRPVRGDAERLPFADASFDLVYSYGVLHHTPDTAGAVLEIHRVLRPGGLAIVGLYHKHSAFHWIYTVLWRGLLLGGLWRKRYRRLLSDIEYRSVGSDAEPLVKVFSRRQCRRLFGRFAETRLRCDQIEWSHLVPFAGAGSGPPRSALEAVARRWGWYLTVFARK